MVSQARGSLLYVVVAQKKAARFPPPLMCISVSQFVPVLAIWCVVAHHKKGAHRLYTLCTPFLICAPPSGMPHWIV